MAAHIFVGTSLDGFIARRDGGLDFLDVPDAQPDPASGDHGYQAFVDSVDALVMGRHTYEKVLTFGSWPYGAKPVVVLSRRGVEIAPALRDRVTQMAGSPAEVAEALASRGLRELYVDGGVTAQGFLRAGLVDRIIVTRVPVLIGDGIPLFGELPADLRLVHQRTQVFGNGYVQSEYRVRR